jgi:hypothetical protein
VPAPAPAPAPIPAPAPAPAPISPVGDAGDTLATAIAVAGTTRLVGGTIGDGTNGKRDIDLYRVTLQAGQALTIDIDARSLARRSNLDSVVRFFDASGRELARNDDYRGSYDSYLEVSAPTAGTYYVGVSGYGNASYNLVTGTAPKIGSTGAYEVIFSLGATSTQNPAVVRTLGMLDADPVPAETRPAEGQAARLLQLQASNRDAVFAAAAIDWLGTGSSTNARSGSRRVAV